MLAIVGRAHPHDACSHWRVVRPFAALERAGYPVAWGRVTDPLTPLLATDAEVLLSPRLVYGVAPDQRAKALARLAKVHDEGRISLYEVDDDLFSESYVERLQALHGQTRTQAEEAAAAYRWTVAQFDGVTVSTKALARVVRRYTVAPVEVVPNAIDLEWFRAARARGRRLVPGLTIGWAGGNRPDSDVALMAEGWRRVARRYPKVTFVVQGHVPEVIRRLDFGGRLGAIPWLPIERYPEGLVNVDIGCCPLESTEWNSCKTPIKAYEWAANGSAVVVSPLLYSDVIENGRDGYIATSADEWEESLSRLVESRPLRERLAGRLLQKVEARYSLAVNVESWPQAWAAIRRKARPRRGSSRLPLRPPHACASSTDRV